jgi:hypothetical protein
MRQIDMSRQAVTARLKLVSQLRRLCLSLGTAKIRSQPPVKSSETKNQERAANDPAQQRK